MLDDDDGVADITQAFKSLQQAVIVALVQADRRFIEHVKYTCKAGADLRGQANTLGLAARECARGAREIEVVEANIHQEGEALINLFKDFIGNLGLLRCKNTVILSGGSFSCRS